MARRPKITFRGKTQSPAAWARELGVNRKSFCRRLDKGETIQEIADDPCRKGHGNGIYAYFLHEGQVYTKKSLMAHLGITGSAIRYRWDAGKLVRVAKPIEGQPLKVIPPKPSRHTPAYVSWHSMKTRCNNPKATSYENYGGRGITVCSRWDSFLNFLEDMGPRPKGTSLDRIDVDGNYKPSNCRWATYSQQAKSQRDSSSVNYLVTNGTRVQSAAEWARELGEKPRSLRRKLRAGIHPILSRIPITDD